MWYDLNNGIVLPALWLKYLFKLVEEEAQYLGLSISEALFTNK